jgi:hypothetical protein
VNRPSEHGIALIIVLMTTTLLAALVGSLTLAVITDTAVAAHYRDAADARYAAEAAMEFALQEIAAADDWSDLLAGGRSAFVDGAPLGIRQVGAERIDLDRAGVEVTVAAVPPPGAVHVPSVLHAFGWFKDLVPGVAAGSAVYVAVWVADRSPAPKDDGAPPAALSVVGAAFGGRGTRRAVEAIVERTDSSAVRLLAWRELP